MIQTRSILAAYYTRFRRSDTLKKIHTHVYITGRKFTLCGTIPADHLADENATDEDAIPTCPKCRARDPRDHGVGPRERA